jgi:hypothetical protein
MFLEAHNIVSYLVLDYFYNCYCYGFGAPPVFCGGAPFFNFLKSTKTRIGATKTRSSQMTAAPAGGSMR